MRGFAGQFKVEFQRGFFQAAGRFFECVRIFYNSNVAIYGHPGNQITGNLQV